MPNSATQVTTASRWTESALEIHDPATSDLGMMYRVGGSLNDNIKKHGEELNKLLADKTELDNPQKLALISAHSGYYNTGRQAQSNIMKSLKDTAQAIVRNF